MPKLFGADGVQATVAVPSPGVAVTLVGAAGGGSGPLTKISTYMMTPFQGPPLPSDQGPVAAQAPTPTWL